MTAFAASSVKVGMQFDSSMSQVAATMGTTVDQIQELRDFALEMGSTTTFSASQAAEALNYMALAGYDANTSMEMLPTVLDLAAAGGIDLAYASDMVTDASSALGLSLEETSDLVDKMATASSKSNTSVAQLGEAILTVGGTAKNLKGGTTELATALGILADNGIKGAEGGTALRNIILSLSAPTDTAAAAMRDLGLEVFDAQGNMRSMDDIFGDLNNTLSTMTQGEQTQALNKIFNKVDLKSVNALLANTGERFGELSGYIDKASGSAAAMAETQLDNLAGDITKFKSALEGAQIAISDQLTPVLREFVSFGSNAVSELSTAFKEGGLTGAMDALGTILSDGLTMVIEELPHMISAGASLLEALMNGLIDNIPQLSAAATEILIQLAGFFLDNIGIIIDAAFEFAKGVIDAAGDFFAEKIPALSFIFENLRTVVAGVTAAFVAYKAAVAISTLIDALSKSTEGLSLAQRILNAVMNANPFVLIATLLAGLVTAVITLWNTNDKFRDAVTKAWEDIKDAFAVVVETIKAIFKPIVEWFSGIWDSIKGVFSGAFDWFKDIGGNIVKGIWDGISAMGNWIKEKVGGFFGGIVDGVKGLLGIHSPSTVMAEVGENMSKGVAVGIATATNTAVKAAGKMGKQVVAGAMNSLSRISNEISEVAEEVIVSANEMGEQIPLKTASGIKETVHKAVETVKEVSEEIYKEYSEKIKTIFDNINDLEESYQSALTKRTKEIVGSFGLFDKVNIGEQVSGQQLISNLENQINAIDAFYSGLDALANRGVGDDLVETIRSMGVGASNELYALLRLSDEQLQQYAELFGEKQSLANDIALSELEDMRNETSAQIMDNLAELQTLYEENAPAVGKVFADGLADGIKAGMSSVIQAAVSVAQNAMYAAQDVLGISVGSLGTGTQNIDFANSGIGISSAGIANSFATAAPASSSPMTFNLMLPDGTVLASYLLNPLTAFANANGTPILNPI